MLFMIISAIELLCVLLLQTTVMPYLEIGQITPNLFMILVVAAGYQRGRLSGMWTGFACGLMLDFVSGGILGVNALFLLLIGYAVGYLNRFYTTYDMFLPLAITAVGQLVYSLLVYSFDFLLRGNLHLWFYVKRIMLPSALYTCLVSLVVYVLLDWIYQAAIKKEETYSWKK